MSSQLVSIAETAKSLGVSKDTVRRLIRTGALRAVPIARRVMVPQSEIDRACSQGVRSHTQ
jgi:excisionase family DNA binding protein